MPERPDLIVLRHHRDLEGRQQEAWVRRGLLLAVGAFIVAGLLSVFGQRATSTETTTSDASLEVGAPNRVRGGLLCQARFTIRARHELMGATLARSR